MDSLKAVCEGCDAFCNGYMDRAILCFENVLLQEEYTPTVTNLFCDDLLKLMLCV